MAWIKKIEKTLKFCYHIAEKTMEELFQKVYFLKQLFYIITILKPVLLRYITLATTSSHPFLSSSAFPAHYQVFFLSSCQMPASMLT